MSEFRFSPRPNRADEIGWMAWGDDAFARAAAEDKPILLSISAVWCHWCHVMDETSYSDPGVIEAINRALRAGTRRQRPPPRRQRALQHGRLADDRVPGARRNDADRRDVSCRRSRCAARSRRSRASTPSARTRSPRAPRELATRGAPRPASSGEELERRTDRARSSRRSRATYDEEFGGFGDEPKFPQPERARVSARRVARCGAIRTFTTWSRARCSAMSRGGMYDHVEGGFFRYSTTRDWSVPHFEKMAEDHAGLLRVLAGLATFAPTDEFRATLVSALGYVRDRAATIRRRDSSRAARTPTRATSRCRSTNAASEPRRTSTARRTRTGRCALAGALCLVARALDDDALLALALTTLDNVHDRAGRRGRSARITCCSPAASRRCAGCSPIRSPTCARCSTRTRRPESRASSSARKRSATR